MPLRKCTWNVIYVDTKEESERVSLIKPWSQLKELPETSVNVVMDSKLKDTKDDQNQWRVYAMQILCLGISCVNQKEKKRKT